MIYKYKVDYTSEFKKEQKKIKKQGKNLIKLELLQINLPVEILWNRNIKAIN